MKNIHTTMVQILSVIISLSNVNLALAGKDAAPSASSSQLKLQTTSQELFPPIHEESSIAESPAAPSSSSSSINCTVRGGGFSEQPNVIFELIATFLNQRDKTSLADTNKELNKTLSVITPGYKNPRSLVDKRLDKVCNFGIRCAQLGEWIGPKTYEVALASGISILPFAFLSLAIRDSTIPVPGCDSGFNLFENDEFPTQDGYCLKHEWRRLTLQSYLFFTSGAILTTAFFAKKHIKGAAIKTQQFLWEKIHIRKGIRTTWGRVSPKLASQLAK